jgi:hypothetical protein
MKGSLYVSGIRNRGAKSRCRPTMRQAVGREATHDRNEPSIGGAQHPLPFTLQYIWLAYELRSSNPGCARSFQECACNCVTTICSDKSDFGGEFGRQVPTVLHKMVHGDVNRRAIRTGHCAAFMLFMIKKA